MSDYVKIVVAQPRSQTVCTDCGTVVYDEATHDAFHEWLKGVIGWAAEEDASRSGPTQEGEET